MNLNPIDHAGRSDCQRSRRIFLSSGGHGVVPFLLLIILFVIPFAEAQPSPPPPTSDPYQQYARFTPSMAIIIVILIAALFLMAFFSIYIRHCSEFNSSSSTTLRGGTAVGGGRSRRGPRGLDPAVIETFPTLVYSTVKGLKIGKSALECAVCLNEFEDEETLRLIPKCDHVFHPECIDAWLELHTTCPVCRADLVPKPGESPPQLAQLDLESQSSAAAPEVEDQTPPVIPEEQQGAAAGLPPLPPTTLDLSQRLNRNRTRGSRSGRPRKFPRSHSTGHSVVAPGENTDRFTLRLPVEVRKNIMNRQLQRATSLVVLPREGSSRRGYRSGSVGGSSRGKYYRRLEEMDDAAKPDRWGFGKVGPFLSRMSSSFRSLSIRSTKVAANSGEGTSARPADSADSTAGSSRPPV